MKTTSPTPNPLGMDSDELFNWENPDSEEVSIDLIKKYLRTPAQKEMLDKFDLTIADLLNGRYAQAYAAAVQSIFDDWNQRLGEKHFGY